MSFTLLPPSVRTAAFANAISTSSGRRCFHSSHPTRASVLFALSALSNSRETQHFNKLSRLPRAEHSPPLKLIKSSEVDPFPCPTPRTPPPRPLIRPTASDATATRAALLHLWDRKALHLGRTILTDHARRTHRLTRSLARAHRRAATQTVRTAHERRAWHAEREKLRSDMRAAGLWILLSVGAATALATWRFWPEREARPDSGQLGRKIAARAAAAMPLPPAVSIEPTVSAPVAVPVQVPVATASTAAAPATAPVEVAVKKTEVVPPVQHAPSRSWWKGLFWKQQ